MTLCLKHRCARRTGPEICRCCANWVCCPLPNSLLMGSTPERQPSPACCTCYSVLHMYAQPHGSTLHPCTIAMKSSLVGAYS